jgi:hypothetical protein
MEILSGYGSLWNFVGFLGFSWGSMELRNGVSENNAYIILRGVLSERESQDCQTMSYPLWTMPQLEMQSVHKSAPTGVRRQGLIGYPLQNVTEIR